MIQMNIADSQTSKADLWLPNVCLIHFFLYQKMIQMNVTGSQTSKARLMVAKVEGRVRL